MAIDANKMINVLNENPIVVTVKSNLGEYVFDVGSPENPTMQTMKFSEIQYIYRNGHGIQNGLLVFEKDEEKEIYESLGFSEWQDILRISDIEDILTNPDIKKLQRIIDIKNIALFERVRMNLIGLNSTGRFDVSNRVADVVNRRFAELISGIRNSNIIVQSIDVDNISTKDVKSLQEEVENLKRMLQEATKNNTDKSEEKPKRSGRPKKTDSDN